MVLRCAPNGVELPNGRYLHCPEGAHLARYDDPETYYTGLIRFLYDVDSGAFP